MPADPTNPRTARDDTDANLLAERTKTDDELARTRTAVEEEADHVVSVARARAEATLSSERERADRSAEGAAPKVRRAVAIERRAEDGAVAEERAVADERLRMEREEHQQALSALLRLEREATDDGLVIERADADDALTMRDNFLGIVSHDLRSMLGGIALSAAMLTRHGTGEGEAGLVTLKHSERIQRFTARMTRLVGDLLDVVSLEAGKLRMVPQWGDAVLLVQDALEVFQPSFAAKGIALTTSSAPGAVLAHFDHDRMLQVIANLLGNALKFTPRGGHVTLSLTTTGTEVRFSVVDDGDGFPADQAEAIFERFRQLGASDRRGLGLGLYIAKSIVDAHGGTIVAESPGTGGTAIHFTLPADAPPPAAPPVPPA